MINEFKNSIQSVLSERISSPFSGAFIFSWFVWNWKFLYYLITTNDYIFSERIKFIESNYLVIEKLLIYPILSAIFFVTIYPFVTTGAMYIWLKFKKWQNDLSNNIENQRLLTVEQSINLRLELKNYQEKFTKLFDEKDLQIKLLKEENEQLKSDLNNNKDINYAISNSFSKIDDKLDGEELKELLTHPKTKNYFENVVDTIQRGSTFDSQFPYDYLAFLESMGVIQKSDNSNYYYEFTKKGKKFIRFYFKNKDAS